MEVTIESLGIDKLSVADRLRLIRDIAESVQSEVGEPPPLTEEQCREIDRRLARHAADPSKAVPWAEVKARSLARVRPPLKGAGHEPESPLKGAENPD